MLNTSAEHVIKFNGELTVELKLNHDIIIESLLTHCERLISNLGKLCL